MRTVLADTMAHLNQNYESGNLIDVAVIAVYQGGRSSAEYTEGIENRASNVIGYLTALVHELVPFVRR